MKDTSLEIFGIKINVERLDDEKQLKEIISLIFNFEKYCIKNMAETDKISSFKIIGENATLNFSYSNGSLDTYVEVKGQDVHMIARNFNIDLFFKIYNINNLETCFDRMKNYKKLENIKLYTPEYINGIKENVGGHDER